MVRRRLLIGSLTAAAIIGIGGGWWLASRGGAATEALPPPGAGSIPDTGIPVATDVRGDPVPDVTARTLDGRAVALRSLLGQPLILNFWSSTCIPCRKEMPAFEAVHRAVDSHVRIVGIDPQDSPDAARKFATRVAATYELLRDPDGAVTSALGVAALPTTVFVSPDGTILEAKAGALSEAELRSTIAALYPT
jgi:peroxiredoxin